MGYETQTCFICKQFIRFRIDFAGRTELGRANPTGKGKKLESQLANYYQISIHLGNRCFSRALTFLLQTQAGRVTRDLEEPEVQETAKTTSVGIRLDPGDTAFYPRPTKTL